MSVTEHIGLRTVPGGWPVDLPPYPNPGTSALTLATDDRVFLHGRDYALKEPESYSGSHAPDKSTYTRVYELKGDNRFDANGRWIGRHSYVSKRREWLFCASLVGYPFMSNGELCRDLPEPLTWGGSSPTGTSPPYYPHDVLPVWMWKDSRHAYKRLGNVTAGSRIVPMITAGLAAGMQVRGYGIPDGATISSVDGPLQITISELPSRTIEWTQLWAFTKAVDRFTHWCTAIGSVEGVGEAGQCPHAGTGATYVELLGTLTSGSPVVSFRGVSDTNISLLAGGLTIAGSGITDGTTVLAVGSNNTLTMSANATANGSNVPIGVFGGNAEGWPANESYERLRITAVFTKPNYMQMLKSDIAFGGEFSRNCLWQDEASGKVVQARGGANWVTIDGYGQPTSEKRVDGATFAATEGFPLQIPNGTIICKWLDVPIAAWNYKRIIGTFGHVNQFAFPLDNHVSPFINFATETLVLRAMSRMEKVSEAGIPVYDLTFVFDHRPATDGFGQWNRVINPLGALQRFLNQASGDYYYPAADYAKLFLP